VSAHRPTLRALVLLFAIPVTLACRGAGRAPAAETPVDATEETMDHDALASSCEKGDRDACVSLAEDLELQHPKAFSENQTLRFAALLLRSCQRDREGGVCNAAGVLYAHRDETKTVVAYTKGCELGVQPSCTNLAYRYVMGISVEKDLERAEKLYKGACEGEDPGGCSELAAFYIHTERDVPFQTLISLFTRACDAGWPGGCTGGGRLYMDGTFVPPDYPLAEVWLRKACDDVSSDGCVYLGDLLENEHIEAGKDESPLDYFDLACRNGDAQGCIRAYRAIKNGTKSKKHIRPAKDYLHDACTLPEFYDHDFAECANPSAQTK
jgi:TPR repeat protein